MKSRLIGCIASIALVAGCGGGSGGTGASTGGGTGGTGVTSTGASVGVMAKGSVIVNGVRFDDAGAEVLADGVPSTPSALQNGMMVQVKGTFGSDGVSGTADSVLIQNEVRGTVTSISLGTTPPRFTVLGQTVLVGPEAVLANFTALAQLAANVSFVEVHGPRGATGNIEASRIELVGGGAADEIRGSISALDATSFSVAGVAVQYLSTTPIAPAGATLSNGAIVEVQGAAAGTVLTAARIRLDDPTRSAEQGQKLEVEGLIVGFTAHPGSFQVSGRSVQTTAGTVFIGGSATNLVNSIKIEAEGSLSGSNLVASKIVFKRRTMLTGLATVSGDVLTVLGKSVTTDAGTDIRSSNGTLAALDNQRVEVRSYTTAAGTMVANRIDDIGSSGGQVDIIQALVTAKNESARTLTLLGINAQLGGASQFQNTQDQSISSAQFFGLVVPNATMVKVKGVFSAGTIAVTEAEIEN